MGYRGNSEKDEDLFIPAMLVLGLLAILFVSGVGFLISKTPDCFLQKVKKVYPDELVKSVNYGHSFLDGDYCTIVTNKDMYTISKDEDCFNNKIGKPLIFHTWENTCEDR